MMGRSADAQLLAFDVLYTSIITPFLLLLLLGKEKGYPVTCSKHKLEIRNPKLKS
jgi:hypothetical protein